MTPAVQLTDLSKRFRVRDAKAKESTTITAVDGINLTINTGEIVALLGPNGAGKTTTLDMLLGLQEASSGSAEVFGMSPRAAISNARVSAVFQTGGLLRDITALEAATVIASTFGTNPTLEPIEALRRAGIEYAANRRIPKLSGGEQQKIRFALALLPDPDLLILDEPTAGMDAGARIDFWATMREEASNGRTIIFATHYLDEADEFAQHVVMMSNGKIVVDGPTAEVRARTHARRIAATFAQGEILTVPASDGILLEFASRISDDAARALLAAGAQDLEIAAPSLEDSFLALTKETSR